MSDVGTVELQPLNTAPSSSPSNPRLRWRREVAAFEPRLQKKLWIAVGVAVVIAAGVVFAAVSTGSGRARSPPPAAAGDSLQGGGTRVFPAEPFLAPASKCQLDTQPLGPELQTAIPLNYHVSLQLSDQAFFQAGDPTGRVAAGFAGAVNITLLVKQDASCISLHAQNLTFSSITASLLSQNWKQQQQQQQGTGSPVCLCGAADQCLTAVCARLFKARQGSDAWILSLGPLVAPAGSTLLLQVSYRAAFGTRQGLWRSSPYPSTAAPGQQVVTLSTELEMNAARTVLPCLDEPRYKATFVVEVEAPSHLTVLSNSLPATTINTTGGNVTHVSFLPSPPMSTYLLSIAVGELSGLSARTNSGHMVRVWTTPDTVGGAAVPMQLSVSAVQHYQQYTGIQQGRGLTTKWDLLAVPGKMGAVENWALLMMDPERFLLSSGGAWDLFRCANVICHELAHQWFGNLVTATTWPDLLVNEGLATLMEYGCMAAVLPQQVGPQGAAVLLRGMWGSPHAVTAGVHEGPFDKTLTYDASPLAEPLLGAGAVDFGVPVYSKAAALMVMMSHYATAAAAAGAESSNATTAYPSGPVEGLMGSTPPSRLQVVLQQHLQQHAYGSATAQDTLQRIISLSPGEVSDNALAVIMGWHNPGSPLIDLQPTAEGLKLTQRRFCSWGLLSDTFLTQLLDTAAAGGGGSGSTHPAPPPPPANSSSSSAPSSSGILFCPTSAEGRDRAVPWTPLYVGLLPPLVQPSNSSNVTTGNSSDSNNIGDRPRACGFWAVMRQDEQLLDTSSMPGDGCPAAAAAALTSSSPGYVLEADGACGLFRTRYPPAQRIALRKWVVSYVSQAPGQHGAASSNSSQGLDVQQLLAASKILQDQAVLSLSAFGEVPGAEMWAVLQAAVNASLAASHYSQQAPVQAGSFVQDGFGTVLYSLLAPLLPSVEVLLDRLAAARSCWLGAQERLAAALSPVAAAAMSAFAVEAAPGTGTGTNNITARYHTHNQFLGAMSLNRILTATGMVDADTASKLCVLFNKAAAAAAEASEGGSTAAEDASNASLLLSSIHPDLQHAVLDVAAAQPPGCQLDWSGGKLLTTLQRWYLDSREPRTATLAAFALAHLPARGHHSPMAWPDVLALLLAINRTSQPGSSTTQQPAAQHSPSNPASGIHPAKHAVELAVLVSRSVTASRRFPQPEIGPATGPDSETAAQGSSLVPDSKRSGPVVAVLIRYWQQLVGSVGPAMAWDVMREVAVQEVLTVDAWQGLAAWAVQQLQGQSGAPPPGSVVGKVQRRRVQGVLGAAWSTVSWVQANTDDLCRA